jgi:hypothetical protein
MVLYLPCPDMALHHRLYFHTADVGRGNIGIYRVHKMYSKISAQRKELNMEFSIVKWSIFLIISTFVLSAIYRLVMSGGIV